MSLRAKAAANNKKKSSQPRVPSPLKSSREMSPETLSDLNKQLESFSRREHLSVDNTYEDSRAASPSASHVDLALEKAESEPPTPEIPKKTKKRYRFRNLSNRHQASILDMQSSRKSTFFGFYTLFWLTVAVMIVRTAVYNYISYGRFMGDNITNILHRDLIKIALTDGAMYLVTYFGVILQLGVKYGYIDWDRSGWVIQNVYQTGFLFFFMWFADYMDFPWIGNVFLLLHSLVMLMKMHSYAFYNGYLWRNKRELNEAKVLLSKVVSGGGNDDQVSKLNDQIDFCREELDMQSTTTPFPKNITFGNYFQYSMFPTVVYQIDYPRTDRIRWSYVLEKVAAVFGVMFLMIVIAENYLYPCAMRAIELRDTTMMYRLQQYPFVLMDLVPPFILMYLLVFYIIWDAILNAIAELTRFADREFYGEWWNCVTWDQFAKDWNTPVHRFLLRHVYHSSMSALQVSKPVATLLTFFLSSCVHELVMLVIFKKLRGYLLVLQMCQLPLVQVSRTKMLRGQDTLGNIVFWIGIITGPSLMCSLYLTF